MIPQKGQQIKCFFRTGVLVEGTVEEWSDQQAQLIASDSHSIIIITNPKQDVMMIKIMLTDQKPSNENKKIKDLNINSKIDPKINPFDDLKNKKLAELKIELNKQEREIISQKMKEHQPTNIQPIRYYYPNILTKKEK